MANQYTALITRLNGQIVVVDEASSVPEISLTVYDELPGSASLVLANTWSTMPTGSPTATYAMEKSASAAGVYTLQSAGETTLLALLKAGGVYRFVWRFIYRGVAYEVEKRVTWPTPASAGRPPLRAGNPPMQFDPTVEGVAIDPDQVTLSGTAYVRAGLVFVNLTATSAQDVDSWSGVASTQTPATWSSSTSYVVGNTVNSSGTTFICKTDSLNETPSATAYNGATAYVVGDFVSYSGSIYRCTQAGTGNTPSSSSAYWAEIWQTITTTLSSGNSKPLYAVQSVVQGRYAIGDSDASTMLASLVHGNRYKATWTFVYNGVTYTSSSEFVYQAAGNRKKDEQNNYSITFADLKKRMFRYIGDDPGTMSMEDLINEATLMFFQEAAFVFPEGDTTYIDEYKDNGSLEVPEDFGGIRGLMRANDNVHRCIKVSLQELAALRERNWTGSNNITYYHVKTRPGREPSDPVTRTIEVFPYPATTTPNAYRLDYLRVPSKMINDSDVPQIPRTMLPVYLQYLRAYASEVEQEAEAPAERAKFDRMVERASNHDAQMSDNLIGPLNPYASTGRNSPENYYLPVNPNQGPDYNG